MVFSKALRHPAGNTQLKENVLTPTESTILAGYEEKQHWRGFCEIESEPAIFNYMLDSFGVQGVKVQEIISLDADLLAALTRPVYGLIFLSKWTEEKSTKQQQQTCPAGVWFANQTSNFSCASVALLNIINNIPDIELGEHLATFKQFTQDFTPALRGDAISNFDFIKAVHNSFARKIDMLNTDLALKEDVASKKKKKKKQKRGTPRSEEGTEDSCEAGFHFVAFLPIKNSLWKLDGLERQPIRLGSLSDDWLDDAKPELQARMAQYEQSQIEFAIMGLVKDPLLVYVTALSENIKSINVLGNMLRNHLAQEHLDKERGYVSCWRDSLSGHDQDHETCLKTVDPALGITPDHIESAIISQDILGLQASGDTDPIFAEYDSLVHAQTALRMAVQEEKQSQADEKQRAIARTFDFGPNMQKFAAKVKSMGFSSSKDNIVEVHRQYSDVQQP